MIDVIAAAALLVSGLLALLGAVGLVRFDDVFTRMHAAAKASTLGVILATLAAAIEIESLGGASLLVLVAALLFLSAPLGTSLLARAAYADPATPRLAPVRDELARIAPRSEPEQMPDRPGSLLLLVGWLGIVWFALFGSGSPGVLAGAVAVGFAVAVALPSYRPRWPEGIFKPVAAIRFGATFLKMLVVANADVAAAVLSGRELKPAIVGHRLRVGTRTELLLMLNAVTFTPGTVAIDMSGPELYVHVMDLGRVDDFRRSLGILEDRIIAAFGTSRERARHG